MLNSNNEVLLRWAGCKHGEDLDRERSTQLWHTSPPFRQVSNFPPPSRTYKNFFLNHNSYRFIEKYLLCQKCKYPETSMFIKQKKLMSKCRACGNENILDGSHRAGTQLMKNLPKDMSEIDQQKKDPKEESKGEAAKEESGEEGEKKEKKKKKKAEAEEPIEDEPIELDSEETGK